MLAPAAPPAPAAPEVAAAEVAPTEAAPTEVAKADATDDAADGEVDEQEVEVKGAPATTEPAATPAAEGSALAKVDALWDKGAKLHALALLKHAAKRAPNDVTLQKALVARAEEMREWGEAVKAARRWALLDASSEARLSLARSNARPVTKSARSPSSKA